MGYVVVALVAMQVGAICYRLFLDLRKERTSRGSPDTPRSAEPKPTLADAIEKCRRERAEMIQAVRDRDPSGYLTLADDGRLQFGNNMFVEYFPPGFISDEGHYGIGYYTSRRVAQVTSVANTVEEVILKVAAELTRTLK